MEQPIWNTPSGSLGTFPSLIATTKQLSARAILPATTVLYKLLSGSLPKGMTFDEYGLISGTPTLVTETTTSTFTVRVTDNLQSIRDRTFSMSVSGTAIPSITTPTGSLLSINDSIWVELPIEYTNPVSTNKIAIRVLEGTLPPGLEVTENGLIRGYAEAPIINVTVPRVITSITSTATTNLLTCISTTGFTIGRPIVFSGTSELGALEFGKTYYVKTVNSSTTFSISATQNGPVLALDSATGFITATLSAISVGQPIIRTYSFTLVLESALGEDSVSYSITVINQNTAQGQGGPGFPANTRIPTIYNTRPSTLTLTDADPYFGYYILPTGATASTIPPTVPALIGTVLSDNYFAFKINGHDFDNNVLQYAFSGLPSGLVGDVNTGWVTGTPILSSAGINQYSFSVAVFKAQNPSIQSPSFNFSFNVSNMIDGIVTWITPSNLGTIFNGTISTKSVLATSDVPLSYRVVGGTLPPNLTLLSNGEITGYIADQPTSKVLSLGDVTEFSFTIQAYSPTYPVVQSSRTFTMPVVQAYDNPTDILYIKATPSLADRSIINSLLSDNTLIPDSALYRASDVYFGKASSVIYEHAYGIYASDIDEYLSAITKNHYWRNLTLGEIKTAVAKNEAGDIIYEVVYSEIIDNLVNPKGVSISSELYWNRPIDLGGGPWYTSISNIYTSYVFSETTQYIASEDYLNFTTENGVNLTTEFEVPTFYTSLTPGYQRKLYPNSLFNMRNRIKQVLGQEYDSRLLPQWMTSQQENGSTLGYTQAWVICYTKPGQSKTIKNNINTKWPHKLNIIDFKIDRFSVDKSITYNYDKKLSPPTWTGLPSASPVPNPINSKDFYVLFPRQNILPDKTEQ